VYKDACSHLECREQEIDPSMLPTEMLQKLLHDVLIPHILQPYKTGALSGDPLALGKFLQFAIQSSKCDTTSCECGLEGRMQLAL
jgi:hypothetical protein